MPAIDVFIDFSRGPADVHLSAAIVRLDSADLLGDIAARVTCAVPSGFSRSSGPSGIRARDSWVLRTAKPVEVCSRAMAAAADANRLLLVLLGEVEPGC